MEMPSKRRSSGASAPSSRGALKFAMRSRRTEMKPHMPLLPTTPVFISIRWLDGLREKPSETMLRERDGPFVHRRYYGPATSCGRCQPPLRPRVAEKYSYRPLEEGEGRPSHVNYPVTSRGNSPKIFWRTSKNFGSHQAEGSIWQRGRLVAKTGPALSSATREK
jgi:hypothetical protein